MSAVPTRLQQNYFLLLLLVSGIVMFFICKPFISPLIIAISFAIVFHPLYELLLRKLNNRRNLAALLTVVIIFLLVVAPLTIVGVLLFGEAKDLYLSTTAESGAMGVVGSIIHKLETQIATFAPNLKIDVAGYVQGALEWLLSHLDVFFSGFFSVVVGTFIMVIALFFLLRDGKTLREKIIVLSPLQRMHDQDIFSRLTLAINSVVKGSLVIAIAQGIFATIGFVVAGVPNPIIWGVAATFASLIPGIGTSLVTVPWIIYLLVSQPLWYGLGLAIWAGFGIGLIDNILAPYVLNRGLKIHPFFILISVLGGLIFFGPIGFILGPVALAFFFALLHIYPLIIANDEA